MRLVSVARRLNNTRPHAAASIIPRPALCWQGWHALASAAAVFFYSFVFHLNVCPLFSCLPPQQRTLRRGRQLVRFPAGLFSACFAAVGALSVGKVAVEWGSMCFLCFFIWPSVCASRAAFAWVFGLPADEQAESACAALVASICLG